MRVFLTGVSDVGKTTIGRRLADQMGVCYFDLDDEIEKFYGMSLERLQKRHLSMHGYREEASKVLYHLLKLPEAADCVIALPPSGLLGGYLRVLKKLEGTVIALSDTPENLLKRISFYDVDSKPILKELTHHNRKWYLREIKKDISYFGKSYKRAHLQVDIAGLSIDQSVSKLLEVLNDGNKNAASGDSP